jgi:hypothetical protein
VILDLASDSDTGRKRKASSILGSENGQAAKKKQNAFQSSTDHEAEEVGHSGRGGINTAHSIDIVAEQTNGIPGLAPILGENMESTMTDLITSLEVVLKVQPFFILCRFPLTDLQR